MIAITGPSQGLKIRGAGSTVVSIICPLVEIGLTGWPKTGASPPARDGPALGYQIVLTLDFLNHVDFLIKA